MTATETMTIQKSAGRGFVLFGNDGDKWVEKWFATAEKAATHAAKNGWTVIVKEGK